MCGIIILKEVKLFFVKFTWKKARIINFLSHTRYLNHIIIPGSGQGKAMV